MSQIQTPRRTPEEWLALITAARQSGLSDAEWCRQNDTKYDAFSSAVKRLRKKACVIPKKNFSTCPVPENSDMKESFSCQDVVRVGIIKVPGTNRHEIHTEPLHRNEAARLSLLDGNITILNSADPMVIASIVSAVRRSS